MHVILKIIAKVCMAWKVQLCLDGEFLMTKYLSALDSLNPNKYADHDPKNGLFVHR